MTIIPPLKTFSNPHSIISIVLKSAFKKEGYDTIFGVHAFKGHSEIGDTNIFFTIKFVFFCFDCTAIILIKLFFFFFLLFSLFACQILK